MNYYFLEFMFNKNKSTNTEKVNKKKRLTTSVITLTLISLLILAPVTLFSSVSASTEPSLESILSNLGFTNIAFTGTETFSSGIYNISLMAEFAGLNHINTLSYYPVGTTDYYVIIT